MPRPNQSEMRRKQLIPEIARAFAGLGYRRTTTAELARRCGVRENILYRLWPDKKAMFIAAIDFVYDLSAEIWQKLLKQNRSGTGSAERLLKYEAEHHGEFGFYRIVFAGLSEADDPAICAALGRMYKRFHQFVQKQIDVHRAAVNPNSAADAVLSAWAIIGLGTIASIGREFGLFSTDQRTRLMNEIGQHLLVG